MFVANRVQLIRENTNINQWHYVDTTEIPAVYPSRGLCASDILSTNWLSDPEFLWKEEVYEESIPTIDLLVGDPEVKAVKVFVTRGNDYAKTLDRLSRFSSWTTLLKVVARIKRLGSKRKSPDVVTSKERESAANSRHSVKRYRCLKLKENFLIQILFSTLIQF